MKPLIRVMKALSDPNRLTMIKMLEKKELCVCEITSLLGLAQPTISKHLKNLEDAGLVESKRVGAWVNYSLSHSPETAYAKIMLEHMQEWLEKDLHVQKILSGLNQVDRVRICAA